MIKNRGDWDQIQCSKTAPYCGIYIILCDSSTTPFFFDKE